MKYVIIGASAAGISAARMLRRLDLYSDIYIISKDDRVYSRCMLHMFIGGERSIERINFVDDDFFERNRIHWEKGKEVISVIPQWKAVKTSDGNIYTYDKLLIATGSNPFIPNVEGLQQGKQVYAFKDIKDAIKIKEASEQYKNVVVIGGGLIGLDVASSLCKLGNKVTLVEMKGHILPMQLDREAASRYELLFIKNGVDIYTNKSVSKVILDEDSNVREVKLGDERVIPTDMVIVAVGIRPNVNLVNADTGIKVDKGILVDEYQNTSVKDIYAAGDVCQSNEVFTNKPILTPIWPVAIKQGEVAAYNMAQVKKNIGEVFAFKNSMKFFGLSTISYGYANPPDSTYNVLIRKSPSCYYKIIYKDGIIYGAIIQGDVSGAGVIGKLIQNKYDLSGYIKDLDKIFSITYGDFFHEDERGSFSYLPKGL